MTEILVSVVAVLVTVPITVLLMNQVQAPLLKEISSSRKPLLDAVKALQESNSAMIAKAISKDAIAYNAMLQSDREAARPHQEPRADPQAQLIDPAQLEEDLARKFDALEGNLPVGI